MMDDGSPRSDGGAEGGGLPEGWMYGGVTGEGKHYYNAPGGAVTWSAPVNLPDGWEQKVDPSSGFC